MTWIRILRQLFGVKSSCRVISLKIVLIFSFVSSLQFLSCSARTPLLSFAFPFFRRSMASWISFCVNSGTCTCLSSILSSSSVRDSISCPVSLSSLSYKFRKIQRKHLRFPVSSWWFLLLCFLTWRMMIRFFTDLIVEMFLVPLSLS